MRAAHTIVEPILFSLVEKKRRQFGWLRRAGRWLESISVSLSLLFSLLFLPRTGSCCSSVCAVFMYRDLHTRCGVAGPVGHSVGVNRSNRARAVKIRDVIFIHILLIYACGRLCTCPSKTAKNKTGPTPVDHRRRGHSLLIGPLFNQRCDYLWLYIELNQPVLLLFFYSIVDELLFFFPAPNGPTFADWMMCPYFSCCFFFITRWTRRESFFSSRENKRRSKQRPRVFFSWSLGERTGR